MPIVQRSIQVPYSAEQMFELVNDVEAYPLFMPWCSRCKILSRNAEEIEVDLTFAGAGFSKSFITRNRAKPHKMISIKLVAGPFKHLEGYWAFQNSENSYSLISLNLEFEFSNSLLGFAFSQAFQKIASTLIDAFTKRAEVLYGKRAD